MFSRLMGEKNLLPVANHHIQNKEEEKAKEYGPSNNLSRLWSC